MPIRLKKLIGTILLILLVIVYSLVATTVAVARLSESGPLVHFLFFLLTGLLWIVPAMGIIKWLIIERKPKNG
jgi:archaellum biogenesis protein FlaJ (TadC family)